MLTPEQSKSVAIRALNCAVSGKNILIHDDVFSVMWYQVYDWIGKQYKDTATLVEYLSDIEFLKMFKGEKEFVKIFEVFDASSSFTVDDIRSLMDGDGHKLIIIRNVDAMSGTMQSFLKHYLESKQEFGNVLTFTNGSRIRPEIMSRSLLL